MDIIAQLNEAKSQFDAANALFEEASTELNKTKAALAESEVKVASGLEAFAAKQVELDSKVAEMLALNAKVAELENNAKTVEQKAVEMVADQGIKPPVVNVSGKGGALTKQEAIEQYAAIQDPLERGKFYAKHRETILG